MKYVIIIGDGMSDYPIEELDGRTPLQIADKPNMDLLASEGQMGLLRNVPSGMQPNSDVAIMSIFGYDPKKYYTGRGPLEAAGMDVELTDSDYAFRCNLITEKDGIIDDYSAGHISDEEAEKLISTLDDEFAEIGNFHPGLDYRHLFVLDAEGKDIGRLISTPPHEVVGEGYRENLLEPEDLDISNTLNEMILSSREVLVSHPVNFERKKRGKKLANSIWLWGGGERPKMDSFSDKYGIRGSVISAVTLVKGLGVCAGMEKIEVPGITGYFDTEYGKKAEYGLDALNDHDLVFIHVEAPDEAGHEGDAETKIEAIENIDRLVVGKVLDNMEEDFLVSVTVDHPTPVELRNHVSDPTPFAIFSNGIKSDECEVFDEFSAKKGSKGVLKGHKFLETII